MTTTGENWVTLDTENTSSASTPDAAIAIAYTYGWRKSEILSLERRQLDVDSRSAGRRCAKRRVSLGGCSMIFDGQRYLERAAVPRSVAMKITGHKAESVHRPTPS